MSGSLPTTPIPFAVSIASIAPTFVSVTHSGRSLARARAGHMWLIDLKYPPMTRAAFAPLWAFLQAQQGQAEVFTAVVPRHDAQGTGGTPGTPEIVGAHAIGDKTIPTDGWNATETVLKAGDFVKFSGQAKVYQVTADATTDGAGAVTLAIEPGLREAVIDNEDVIFNDVPFSVALRNDLVTAELDTNRFYTGFTVELVERLS